MKHQMMTMMACVLFAMRGWSADVVKDLSGAWRVTGENISGEVHLPGTLADAGLGRRMTAADWEKDTYRPSKGALTREYQYRGKAVYEREIELTEEEARYPLELVMERVMGYSEVAIDGETIGSCDSLATEHIYQIPKKLCNAGRHKFRIVLDNSNRYNFSEWAHSYGPVMQSVWHGVVGEFALRRQNALRKARVFASWPANGKLVVEVPEGFENCGNVKLWKCEVGRGVLDPPKRRVQRPRPTVVKPSPYRKGFKLVELKLDHEPEPWSEHHPNLYVLEFRDESAVAGRPPYQAAVSSKQPYQAVHQIRFGFRSVSAHDHAIWINGFKWFMRGNLDCCHFPLTGAPDTTKEWWRETFRKLRDEDGINTIRFHSWTPPKAAFEVADEMGIFCVVEAGIWVDRWHKEADKMGFGKPIDGFVQRELRSILELRGNSPSFISLGIGNELGGNDFNVMGKWMNDCRTFDPRRLYIASTARQMSVGDDYTTTHRHPEVGMVRARFKPSTDWDYEDVYGKTRLPVVAHEIGQWPIYVDWGHELAKYKGVLRPYNLEHYRDVAKKSGTERLWQRFSEVSAKLNRLMYKDEVESFMRTPSCAGLQLLSVQDFTGQFEAMIGWRDSFYDLKPSVKGMAPFREIFNPLPYLARFEKYCWCVGETYKVTLVVRNVTEKPILEGTEFEYVIVERAASPFVDPNVRAARSTSAARSTKTFRLAKTINPGDVDVVGEVTLPLTADMVGRNFVLRFGSNAWPFWVFAKTASVQQQDGRAGRPRPAETARPEAAPYQNGVSGRAVAPRPPNPILETSSFDEAVAALAKGGRVLYTGQSAKSAKSHFKPVYWSTGHFKSANAELSTLGYCVRADHPALRGFPTEDWADWQWYNLVEGGVKHGIADLVWSRVPRGCKPVGSRVPRDRGGRGATALPDFDPIVMPVPDLHYSTPMGMLFELKVGDGRLMVCGLNLSDKSLPEVSAMRTSIFSYMESEEFNPAASIEMEKFKETFAPQAVASKMRPAQFADAPVYIAAAVELDAAERSVEWKKALDFVEMKQGGYNVSGKGRWGSWRDSSGSFWHGQGLTVTLNGTRPVNGTLWVRFRDPNRNNRSGRGTCEGRPFTVPKHQDAKDGIWWAKLPVMREDFLDGKIELTCEVTTGPNLMIDRVVLVEDK